MIVYLMRHGDADYPSGTGSDAQRHLSDWGKLQVASMAEVMRRANAVPEQIISSPFVRAVETATIIASALGCSERLSASKNLIPSVNQEDILSVLKDYHDAEAVLLIGHMPSMGGLAGTLTGGGASLEMPTASIAAIRLDAFRATMQGTLLWFVTPAVI